MASMGTGIVEESSNATAPAPQNPIAMMAGKKTAFHLCSSSTKNCFNHGPLPAASFVHSERPLYGCGRSRLRAAPQSVDSARPAGGFSPIGRDETMVRKDSKQAGAVVRPGFLSDECPLA